MPPLNLAALLGAVASAVVLAACGSAADGTASTASTAAAPATRPGETITLYNGQHEQTTHMLVAAFERSTGVKVNVRSDDEAVLGNQIAQEGSNSPADVFYAENTPVLSELQVRGLLAPLAPSTLAVLPARYSSTQGRWVGVSARVSVLVYNTREISPAQLPSSILSLARPQWKGKLGVAPSETDFQPLVTAIAKLDGTAAAERWLDGIKANSRIYPDNETVVSQVNNGESAIGLINHYYWYRLRDEVGASGLHSALHYYAPGDPGSLLNVSGAAVLGSSHHQPAAQAFVAFLLSRAGQEVIAHSNSYEYPLRPGVAPNPQLPPLSRLRFAPVTLSDLGGGGTALELEQQVGLL